MKLYYVEYDGYYYHRGDFFFGFNGNSTQFGISDYDNHLFHNTVEPFGIPETPMGYGNNPSIVAAVGALFIARGSIDLGTIDGWNHTDVVENTAGDTFVREYRIAKSYLETAGVDLANINTVSVHHTISCGNDVLDHTYEVNVVPEPGTLALVGLGLLGTGLIARRKK